MTNFVSSSLAGSAPAKVLDMFEGDSSSDDDAPNKPSPARSNAGDVIRRFSSVEDESDAIPELGTDAAAAAVAPPPEAFSVEAPPGKLGLAFEANSTILTDVRIPRRNPVCSLFMRGLFHRLEFPVSTAEYPRRMAAAPPRPARKASAAIPRRRSGTTRL